ncbi:hypothetical protein BASA84_001023 [Batrachochytrium salamandrivorans]|nr:hypothetical protein BASA84_001023 [Batrachochytrium salamandrivorans]
MLVSHMTRDARVSGTCGETNIANERKSFTSMIQVYEYFISHHLSKAFESLFGSVTCLPGCFSIYRIRTPGKNVPVLIAPGLIADYSENNVDTLHLKNLLHLGEDRYLTTLIMKHFPNMRTTFTADAKCETYAPERWPVLLSQRRRWINSTVHNLLELMNLSELCGFCCFSMRFVVFVDLLATLIQPSALIYLAYLVYASIADPTTNFPIISNYDCIWGNTRKAAGEGAVGQRKEAMAVVEEYDPDSVPLMKWSDYEAQRKATSSDKDDARHHPAAATAAGSHAHGVNNMVSLPRSLVSIGTHHGHLAAGAGGHMRAPNAGAPNDEEILREVRHILATTDLMKVTKKSVREQLSQYFGYDLSGEKEYIHRCIDGVLRGEL